MVLMHQICCWEITETLCYGNEKREEPEPKKGRTRIYDVAEYMMLLNIPDNISGSNRPPQL
jgi:hypothetical protein